MDISPPGASPPSSSRLGTLLRSFTYIGSFLSTARPEQPAKVGKHLLRLFVYVPPGIAAEFVAAGAGLALPLAILLPDVTSAVVAVAVQLDREVMLRPTAVDVAA